MVAISLYRGNLHKLPSNVVRQWLMPPRKISVKDFKTLLRRRRRALRRSSATNPKFKNQQKDEIFGEIGGIEDEGRELEVMGLVEKQKDGVLGEIRSGGRELEVVGLVEEEKDGILGGFGGIKDGGRGLEVMGLVEKQKDGVLGGFGRRGFEGEGVKGVELGEEGEVGVLGGVGKRGFEGEGLEVGELGKEAKDWISEGFGRRGIEGKAVLKSGKEGSEKEKDDLENEGGVAKLGEGKGGDIKEGDEGNAEGVGIKGNDLDCGNGVRIDRQGEMKVARVDDGNLRVEIPEKEEDVRDKEKKRQEIEEKLKILNEKKHNLVQALKQILNVEEELKRRSYIQGVACQLPVGGGQVEGTHDSGSMPGHITPKMSTEGNATLPSRTYSGVANSPSRFALAAHQGLPPHLPSVSVSGTNYIASSPSPAASGGTSAFRDGRNPSPFN